VITSAGFKVRVWPFTSNTLSSKSLENCF
jgi:hypothetical protein